MVPFDTTAWSRHVFGGCSLGDWRLVRRLMVFGAMLARTPLGTIPMCSHGSRAALEGAYRFIENDRVDPSAIAEGGFASTVTSATEHGTLLLVQDTTTLSFTHSVREELGDLGHEYEYLGGWFVHSSLLLEGERGHAVGLLDQAWWARDRSTAGKYRQRKKRPYRDKESYKWEAASRRSAERLGPELMARTVMVGDREADGFDFLSYNLQAGQRFVIRVRSDRRLQDEEARLWAHLAAQPSLGTVEVPIQQRGGRTARVATVHLRSARVTLPAPYRPGGRGSSPIALWAVYVHEDDPPSEGTPLSWMLFTTEAAPDLEGALRVQRYYQHRWKVEEFHKAWKSGCGGEALRMPFADNLRRMLQVLAFVAVYLLQLRDAANDTPDLPCEVLLTPAEWKLLWLSAPKRKRLPSKPPTLRWAYEALGRLGGWTDSKRTGRVGWAALWKGYFLFHQRWLGWKIAAEGNL